MAYDDATGKDVPYGATPVGVLTIGYGHTSVNIRPGMKVTPGRAEDLLKGDIAPVVVGLNKAIKVIVTQSQFDAIVSLAFNCGIHAIISSTMMMKLNRGDIKGASKEFVRWNKDEGKIVEGLTNRRLAEVDFFMEPEAPVSLTKEKE